MKTICRICECDVSVDILKEHSFKCKEFYDKKDRFLHLNNKILRRIEVAFRKKVEASRNIKILVKNSSSEELEKLEDLTKKNKLLRKIIQYGDCITKVGPVDFDSKGISLYVHNKDCYYFS